MFDQLKDTYTIKDFGGLKFHLVCNYTQVKVDATTWWVVGALTYNTEALHKVCALIKVTNLRKDKFLTSPGYHPELDLIPILSE